MFDLVVVPKLDKVTVQRVLAGEFTMKEFDAIKPQLEDRMNYVVRKIVELSNLNLEWWDFDNLGEGQEDRGFFDPLAYDEFVGIVRECTGNSYKNICFEKYEDQIPVRFLWMDFEEQVAKEFEDFKTNIDVNFINAANKAVEHKQKLDAIIASVKSKLTPEEMAYIQFKVPTGSKRHRK